MLDLTAANIEVLRLLNRYRFLTNSQLLRLGLVHDNTSIYKILSRFGDGNRPYIGKKDFGFIAGVGRLHRIYYLQKRGAQLLAETLHLDEDEVSYQKVKPPFLQDYFHRVATIDVHIELDRFAAQYGCAVRFFHTYFDAAGAPKSTTGGIPSASTSNCASTCKRRPRARLPLPTVWRCRTACC